MKSNSKREFVSGFRAYFQRHAEHVLLIGRLFYFLSPSMKFLEGGSLFSACPSIHFVAELFPPPLIGRKLSPERFPRSFRPCSAGRSSGDRHSRLLCGAAAKPCESTPPPYPGAYASVTAGRVLRTGPRLWRFFEVGKLCVESVPSKAGRRCILPWRSI